MKLRKWELAAWIYTAVLLFLTWWPKIEIPQVGPDFRDKIAHFLAFGLHAFLVARATSKYEIKRQRYAVNFTLLVCILFAVIDEAIQGFIPGRVASVGDGVANISGILFTVLVLRYIWLPRMSLQQGGGFNHS